MTKRTYILQHFLNVYNIPEEIKEDLLLPSPRRLKWEDQGEQFYASNKPFILEAKERVWRGMKIPFAFDNGKDDPYIIKKGEVNLNFDFFTACFMLLSGWQELHQKGIGSRLSHRDTWQYRYKCIRLPIVNYYFDVLKTALEEAWGKSITIKKDKTTVFLSHDVQKVNSGWKVNGIKELKSFKVRSALMLVLKRVFFKDIWNNLDFLMSLEESYDVRSTIFLMGRNGGEYADYDLKKKPFKNWVKGIQGRGFEVGVLASNGSHNSANKLGNDLKHLKYKMYGSRSQNLKYRPKKTPGSIDKNKIQYDSSLGFYNEVGFRNGYCYPFIPWDFTADKPASFIEIPLHIQDSAMSHKKYLNIAPKDAVNVFAYLANECDKFKGVISVSWSNIHLSDFDNKDWRKSYERILKAGFDAEYKFKTGYEIMSFSKENGLLS